jgi:hypothetical protein
MSNVSPMDVLSLNRPTDGTWSRGVFLTQSPIDTLFEYPAPDPCNTKALPPTAFLSYCFPYYSKHLPPAAHLLRDHSHAFPLPSVLTTNHPALSLVLRTTHPATAYTILLLLLLLLPLLLLPPSPLPPGFLCAITANDYGVEFLNFVIRCVLCYQCVHVHVHVHIYVQMWMWMWM